MLRDALGIDERDLKRAKQLHRTKERGLSEEYENEDEKKKQNKKSKTEQKPLQIWPLNGVKPGPCIGKVKKKQKIAAGVL
jgi:hypothetical protein